MKLISRKKTPYALTPNARKYLNKYGREVALPISYQSLLRYDNSISLFDKSGKDTLWVTVFYSESDTAEIHAGLKKIYALLKADGDLSVMQHLRIDRIDLCEYGNTLPFRIRVVNQLNDNFDYYYVKRADASRIYGLELEHILSPNKISFLVSEETLIEEHIVGIPADMFLERNLADRHFDEVRLAKEFVKFNERCFIRLLGDMHSSNFVIDVTPDFEEVHYRMRAIDFDQQSFEPNKKVYLPQFFRQNLYFVELVQKHLTEASVKQYQREERALIGNRIRSQRYQIKDLLDTMMRDELAPYDNIEELKKQLAEHYESKEFLKCKTMGDLVKVSLKMIVKKK